MLSPPCVGARPDGEWPFPVDVVVYFGVGRLPGSLGPAIPVVLGAVLVWTAPNRWGAGIALHYLSRLYWPDPEDPIPPPAGSLE